MVTNKHRTQKGGRASGFWTTGFGRDGLAAVVPQPWPATPRM